MTIKENKVYDLSEDWLELIELLGQAMESNVTKGDFKKYLEEKSKLKKD